MNTAFVYTVNFIVTYGPNNKGYRNSFVNKTLTASFRSGKAMSFLRDRKRTVSRYLDEPYALEVKDI